MTDLDGTVVMPGAHEVSIPVVESIKAMEEQGIIVSVVTGRYLDLSRRVLTAIGFKDPCVFDGGATIANPQTGEVLWSRHLSAGKVKEILGYLLPYSTAVSLGSGKDSMAPDSTFDVANFAEPASHVWASVSADEAPRLLEIINSDPELIAHGNPGPFGDLTQVGIHITDIRADKEHGVAQLLELLDIETENVLAIGDGNNDIPLFKNAGTKVAMGNATDLLKAKADIVVGTVENDGFVEAVGRYVLNKSKPHIQK